MLEIYAGFAEATMRAADARDETKFEDWHGIQDTYRVIGESFLRESKTRSSW